MLGQGRAPQRDTPLSQHDFTQTKAMGFPSRPTALQRRKQPIPAQLPRQLEAPHSSAPAPGLRAVTRSSWTVLVAAAPGATRSLQFSCSPIPVLLMIHYVSRDQTFHPTGPRTEGTHHQVLPKAFPATAKPGASFLPRHISLLWGAIHLRHSAKERAPKSAHQYNSWEERDFGVSPAEVRLWDSRSLQRKRCASHRGERIVGMALPSSWS